MTTNRLAKSDKSQSIKSGRRASEWAASARERNLTAIAEAWDKADREGWDDEHYDPNRTAEIKAKLAAELARK